MTNDAITTVEKLRAEWRNSLISTADTAERANLRGSIQGADVVLAELRARTNKGDDMSQRTESQLLEYERLRAGREVTDEMVERATAAWLNSASDYTRLHESIRAALLAALITEGEDFGTFIPTDKLTDENLIRPYAELKPASPPQSHDQACGGDIGGAWFDCDCKDCIAQRKACGGESDAAFVERIAAKGGHIVSANGIGGWQHDLLRLIALARLGAFRPDHTEAVKVLVKALEPLARNPRASSLARCFSHLEREHALNADRLLSHPAVLAALKGER